MNVVAVTSKLAVVGGPKVQLAAAKVAKYSPQILTGVGVVGGIASTVLIAKATLSVEPIVTAHEEAINYIKHDFETGLLAAKESDKEIRKVYFRTGLALVKLYGPGVSLGLASVISVIAAQGIAQKRQVALVAGAKSIESAFQAYRARVAEALGEDKEAEIRNGISTETVEDANGKKTKVKVFNPEGLEPHIVLFGEDNLNWQKGNIEITRLFLKNIQNWSNDRLNSRGYVYLNEVLNWLGLPETPAGQVVGWLHKDLNNGDGYIDFGWENNPVNQAKFGEYPQGILLNFNVDGEINSKL